MSWVIIKTENAPLTYEILDGDAASDSRRGTIAVKRAASGGWDANVHLLRAPAFDWKWNYPDQTSAAHGACGYVRGVERAAEVHASETRGTPGRVDVRRRAGGNVVRCEWARAARSSRDDRRH